MLTIRWIARELRELNEFFDGPGNVGLQGSGAGYVHVAMVDHPDGGVIGNEALPGDGKPFDATAAARRLYHQWMYRP